MSESGLSARLEKWVAWATARISDRMERAQMLADMGCPALAEEETLTGKAMLELMSEFKRMVLEDDGRTDKERTGTEDP